MSDKKKFNEMNEQELKKFPGGTEEVQTLNESDLKQVSGGELYDSADFRCPVCNCKVHQWKTGCEIGGEGPVCPNCNLRGQKVKMIRIS